MAGARKNQHGAPCGEPVSFYIAKTHRGQQLPQDHEIYLQPQINGHREDTSGKPFHVKMGARNTAPREVVDLLLNSKSTVRQTRDVNQAERNPTPQSMFVTGPIQHDYQPDYEIEILK